MVLNQLSGNARIYRRDAAVMKRLLFIGVRAKWVLGQVTYCTWSNIQCNPPLETHKFPFNENSLRWDQRFHDSFHPLFSPSPWSILHPRSGPSWTELDQLNIYVAPHFCNWTSESICVNLYTDHVRGNPRLPGIRRANPFARRSQIIISRGGGGIPPD